MSREVAWAGMPGVTEGRTVRPDPDPTARTNEAVDRLQTSLTALFEAKLAILSTRLDMTDEKVLALRAEHGERFLSIDKQFKLSDDAVKAAFAAASLAVSEQNKSNTIAIDKGEKSTIKSIDQQGDLIRTTTGSLNDLIRTYAEATNGKFDDLKSRITLLEGRGLGGHEAQGDRSAASNLAVAIIGAVIGAAGLIAAVVAIALHRP